MTIPQALPPAGYAIRDVQLEMSLKPFWDTSPEMREAVCREMFLQWFPLCRFAETVSVMLWIGDGSEVLEYQGDPGAVFDWGRYHGVVNAAGAHRPSDIRDDGAPDHDAIGLTARLRDPERRGVHTRSYLYRPEPAVFDYRWLAGLTETLRRVGTEVTGKKILLGMTFDIGPELAISRFKYEWHPEICGGGSLFGGSFVRCDIPLKGDTRMYAGFPQGIPEGASIGAFLGRQCRHFAGDCGFDYLWLSNGFGFALEPWALTGAIFDGERFASGRAGETAAAVLKFWTDFRAEAPDLKMRTRGTNMGTGIDLGSDASPVREIYAGIPFVEPPVNSPWAALDGDVGLELAGWMAHIARTPGTGFRFRYYVHDPWWLNSPWLDRYQRQPFDVYLPLSVSRVRADGAVEAPCDIAFLCVDDSHGCLPPNVPPEVIAHVLHAREFAPDAPAPLVWVYPFDAYHDLTTGAEFRPDLPFFGDWFARGLIAHGVPLNSVADFAEAEALLKGGSGALNGSVLIVPALPEQGVLLEHARAGGRVVFYGPLDGVPELRELLGVELGAPLEGDFAPAWHGADGRKLRHMPVLSAGGWRETGGSGAWTASLGREVRTAACLLALPGGGRVGWVRGSLATAEFDPANPRPIKGPRLRDLDSREFVFSEDLARDVLARMGVAVDVPEGDGVRPMLTIHRSGNAFVFSGYQREAARPVGVRLEMGAPVFAGQVNRIENGFNVIAGSSWWHQPCRAFVKQAAGNVRGRILPAIQHGYRQRFLVSGVEDGTVTFFPPPGAEDRLEILRSPLFPYFQGDFVTAAVRRTAQGPCVTAENVAGEILFSW